jgi:hypothetical protein
VDRRRVRQGALSGRGHDRPRRATAGDLGYGPYCIIWLGGLIGAVFATCSRASASVPAVRGWRRRRVRGRRTQRVDRLGDAPRIHGCIRQRAPTRCMTMPCGKSTPAGAAESPFSSPRLGPVPLGSGMGDSPAGLGRSHWDRGPAVDLSQRAPSCIGLSRHRHEPMCGAARAGRAYACREVEPSQENGIPGEFGIDPPEITDWQWPF